MGIRSGALVALVALVALALAAGCSGTDGGEPPAPARPTTDADCATRIPDDVLATLGWTPTAEGAEATQRGCHRDAEQGYVEVKDRGGYASLCRTLDRTGGIRPGVPVDWLGDATTACAVEPGADVGTTKVVVRRPDGAATLVTVAVLSPTPAALVREAVAALVG